MKMFPRVLSIVALAALILASIQCRRAKQVASTAKEGGVQSPAAANGIKATKDQPFVNSIGMKFVPVEITGGPTSGQKVLFSIWETRRQDYAAYAAAESGVDTSWKNVITQGQPVGHRDDHPVVCVSWEDAGKFCAWLTEKERASGKIGQQDTYRLPTDHEWSCAVGIGDREDASKTPKEKGMKIADVYPWNGGKGTWPPPKGAGNYSGQETKGKLSTMIDGYNDGYMTTAPVGSFEANGNGLYDLGGNVWEWCASSYDGSSDSGTPWMLRGGSWDVSGRDLLSSSFRYDGGPGTRFFFSLGFRCVLVVPSTAKEGGAQSPAAKAPASLPAAGMPKAADLPGFALIPGGEFTMGDALDGDKNAPQHSGLRHLLSLR